jgi:hypothetical protein
MRLVQTVVFDVGAASANWRKVWRGVRLCIDGIGEDCKSVGKDKVRRSDGSRCGVLEAEGSH